MTCLATLTFQLTTGRSALPVAGARVVVTSPGSDLHRTVTTGASGRTPPLCLDAPDRSASLDPNAPEPPYSVYDAEITAEGYLPVRVEGIQMFQGVESVQRLDLSPRPISLPEEGETGIDIPPSALRQPPQGMPEAPAEEGPAPRVLTEIYIPAALTVHLGTPDDTAAQNVTVSFQDYIKNVASSEIYPTWPESALEANIYAQISLALNRVYTEWYRSRGYHFDITNSTAYDQAYVHGRNIFANISRLVDEIFNRYIRRTGTLGPLFAQYCDGVSVTCPGLSQWGTVPLAQNGYIPLNILKYYYGNNIELTAASDVRSIQSSYPGTPLRLGSSGAAVRTIETQLNRIRRNYPAIPLISSVDNLFTPETAAAVTAFQRIFSLVPDGVVGPATWNRISYIYVSVRRLAQLDGEGEPLPAEPPETVLREGDQGDEVRRLQYYLRVISNYFAQVRPVEMDGVFGPQTRSAVTDFQTRFGLGVDGIVGPRTWRALLDVYLGIAASAGLVVTYPGTLLRQGSRGMNVWLMQDYLGVIGRRYPLPPVEADGIFGPTTEATVIAFQRLFGLAPDGIIGENTWDRIVAVRMLL